MSRIDHPTLRAECLMVAVEHVPDMAIARQLADRMANLVIAAATTPPIDALVARPANPPATITSFPPPWCRPPVFVGPKR